MLTKHAHPSGQGTDASLPCWGMSRVQSQPSSRHGCHSLVAFTGPCWPAPAPLRQAFAYFVAGGSADAFPMLAVFAQSDGPLPS